MEAEKRQGRMPDGDAYAALCAAQHASWGRLSEAAERHRRFLHMAAACQAEQQRLCLASLSDLLLLARALLRRGGEALRWARSRWSHVLVGPGASWGRGLNICGGRWPAACVAQSQPEASSRRFGCLYDLPGSACHLIKYRLTSFKTQAPAW